MLLMHVTSGFCVLWIGKCVYHASVACFCFHFISFGCIWPLDNFDHLAGNVVSCIYLCLDCENQSPPPLSFLGVLVLLLLPFNFFHYCEG